MNCCDYGCTRAHNCPAGSVVAEQLLAGETLPELEPMAAPVTVPADTPADVWYALSRCEVAHLLPGLLPFALIGLALVGALVWTHWG